MDEERGAYALASRRVVELFDLIVVKKFQVELRQAILSCQHGHRMQLDLDH